nr:alpha/beta hydrolase [Corynebacterium sp. TAE3-ERU12]
MVLLLHGCTGGWFDFSAQLQPLADRGFHVVVASLRGWGNSDRTPTGYRADVAADDMAGLIRALGHSNALVIGHDLGGVLAWTMASRHPRLTRAIAVLSAPHPLLWNLRSVAVRRTGPPATLMWQLTRPRSSSMEDKYQLADVMVDLCGPDFRGSAQWEQLRDLHRAALAAGAYGPAHSHISWLSHPWSRGRRQWLARLQEYSHVARHVGGAAPALVISGRDDVLTPPEVVQASAELMVGRDGCLGDGEYPAPLIIADCGHFPQYERADVVTAALADFAEQTR